MEFYIKKNATLPVLKVEICKDGRSDFNLNSFNKCEYATNSSSASPAIPDATSHIYGGSTGTNFCPFQWDGLAHHAANFLEVRALQRNFLLPVVQ